MTIVDTTKYTRAELKRLAISGRHTATINSTQLGMSGITSKMNALIAIMHAEWIFR
jgi:hypothetical protein